MDTATLAPATTQFTLEEVVQHGQQSGRSPEEIAGAVKKWRDSARSWGEQSLRDKDPKKWFTGNQKLDARIREELVGTQTLAAAERIHRALPDPAMREQFASQFQTAEGDPAKMPEPGFRSLAETLNREVFQSPAFDLPDARDRAMPLATEAGVILGDFETQTRPEGGLDILIRLDDEKEGSRRKAITVPEITEDDIGAARAKAEEEARRFRQSETDAKAAAEKSESDARNRSPFLWSEDVHSAAMAEVGDLNRQKETARLKAEEAESRAGMLADSDRGRLVLLRERVEEQVKADKDLKKVVGDVALGEDFWRGVQQTHLGARMAIADATGNEEEKTKLRSLIGDLGQIYPGSTNLQFRGGAGAFVSDTSAVMGGMLPTMIVSSVTGGVGMATNTAVGGLTRTAALAPISLSAYGTAYATMLNEADALEREGRMDEAEQRRKDARSYAMLQAAVETGSEFIFKEEMFQIGGKGFLRKVGAGAAQNTAEEAIASVGNAELDRGFRDQLTPMSEIARDAALGTAVGGLMQVPGGIVEIFTNRKKSAPMESAPPGLDDPPASDPSTPPPSSPPPTEEGAPPPQDPATPPPGDEAVFKVGEQTFTWSGSEWTNQSTGEAVDPQAELGLVLQLGEARRQLNEGEQPVSQEVTLNPNETPTILTIDGQRAFLPAPNGKGWLEVFPATGEAPRLANFASEGEIGIAILRRLQAKMAEKQAAAAAPVEKPAEETPLAAPAPAVPERPADGTVSSGKPNGAKARFRWKIVSRADLEVMVVRDIEEAQTRQRKGNVASDEQRERMATGLDPDLVMESPVSSMGAPAVFEGKVLAGNGRADGISEAYRRGLAADYEARIREFAAERGLEVPAEPILIREIVDFAQGDARSFVVESNPKRGGMLAESVSEQALLDSETIGDEVLANLTFTADGNLSAGSLAAVAAKLEEANRGITRTLSGQFDKSEAGRRVMAAFLSRLVSKAGRDASDVASILETDGGKRAVSAIAQAAPRLSRLDDDLSLATPIVESLLEFKSGLSAVSKGEFANMDDWLENRTSELLASNLDPVSREILAKMAESIRSGAAMRESLDEYLELAEAEQRERDNANSTGDIFGDERTNQSPEDIFRKLGRIAAAQAQDGVGAVEESPREPGGQTGSRQDPAPAVSAEAEGQLIPEGDMPFNLSGEVIVEPEAVQPEDTRSDAEKDADSGQARLFEDRLEAPRSPDAEVRRLVEGFTARHPSKRRDVAPARGEAEERHMQLVREEVDSYFGGDVPAGVRVVWDPAAVWDAAFDRGLGVIELNAARLRPGEAAFKIEHEIGHLLFQDAEFVAAFEALWNALPKLQQERISRRVGKSIEKGYYAEGDAFEETRVRALEAIRRMTAGEDADAGVKRAWRQFIAALTRAWKRLTGREPINPERLAAAMIEIGVARMRSGETEGEGVALSTLDFEAFTEWIVQNGGIKDNFIQEDAGRLWIAADVDGVVNEVFGSFNDADEYFRTMSHRGEFLWDVTESYERMVGGIPVRKPDGPITAQDAKNAFYPLEPMPGETPAEVGNLPQFTPMGRPVTPAVLPDAALRYGFEGGPVMRRLPDPNEPHRKGRRIFSVAEGRSEGRDRLAQELSEVQFPAVWVQSRREEDRLSSAPSQVFSLSDGIQREQAAAGQSLANLEATFRASFFAGDFDGSAAAMDAAEIDTFEAFARKLVRLAGAGNPDAAGMLEWVRHVNAGTRPQVDADPELDALLRAMRSRFPNRRRGRAMLDHRQKHHTQDSFERAFAQHVAAGDFQAAYEAVRDSDDSVRIPALKKWMKEARKGDAVAQKNLEWISAIFNGTLPPGVTQKPSAGGSGATPPQAQQQAPPPPPPPTAPKTPPPRPEGVEKLNIPALVFLARKMGTTPLVRRFAARGSFKPSNKRGEHQADPIIRVNEFLAKEDWQQAARTLAHEIGHFIDYIVNAVPHADIVKRLVPLKAVREQFIEDIFGTGTKYSEARKYMTEEAVAISKIMRGDFPPTDIYRNSAVELYADFMSAVMIDPDLAFDTAPLLSHAWFAHLNQKPGAESAWSLVQDLIKGDALHEAIRKDRVVDQRAAMAAVRDRADKRNVLHSGWKKIRNGFAGALWSRYLPAAAKGATDSGKWEFTKRWWEAVTKPKEDDFLAKMEGAEIEASQRGSVLRVRMQRDVYDPLLRHGIDTVQLDEYLTFFQILNEDTATRQYLEANPEEFREFLLWLDDAAGLDRAAEIEGAADSELDQIGASMVGTIQLHETFETVFAMAQSSEAPDIAARGLFAFDIARYQWNQDGHTPETAQKGMDFLKRELGDERFNVLRDAAKSFHRNLAGIVREANDVGLFGDRIWAEKIAPNIGNYVPRMVLDYFTGEMSASIKQRRGSVKTTLPKHIAGEGQAMVLLHKIAKQKQMLFILEQAKDAGWSNEIQPINIPRGKNVETLANKLRKEERKGLRGYFVKGKWKWMVFDDIDVVQWMDTAAPSDLKFIYDIAKANEGFWRLSVTVLNASFALYNNWVRTAITLPMDYGPKAVAHALRQIPEAVNWARASLGLAAPSDRVLDLVERGVLPAFGQYTAGDLLLSDEDLIDQISSGLVGIDALRRGTRVFGPLEKVTNLPGIRQAIQFLGLFTGTAEALPKLAVESLLAKRGLPQWERDRLARMEGIPNTGLSAGKFGTYAGLVSLFYRVWVQGTRRLATLPFNPRTRTMWWIGNVLGLGAIKMFYAAAAAGLLDAMMGGDDEEKQVDWQEAYTRVSPYKIRMADAIFLGWALPDGSYEAPWGHAAIPADWKPIMWRLPFTESGRVTAPLATVWTWDLAESSLNTRSWSEAGRQARDVFFNSVAPSPNPIFENAYYATSVFDPRAPYDPYSGKDVVPKDQWDAGIPSRAWGITKHLLEETPLKNLAPAVKNGIKNEDDLPLWARAVMSIPGASAAISFDNSQLAADYIDRVEERDSVNREARLLRGPRTVQAVSLRSRLNRIPAESRTPEEQAKIDLLNEWYRKAYLGSDLYPGLFRELQASAAGMEGIDVKETKKALEETAVEVLRAVGGEER